MLMYACWFWIFKNLGMLQPRWPVVSQIPWDASREVVLPLAYPGGLPHDNYRISWNISIIDEFWIKEIKLKIDNSK
jgi:hypothetical protein